MLEPELCLSFDDVLIKPTYSSVKSRGVVNTDIKLCSGENPIHLSIPLISSPMDTVTETDMAIALGKLGGMGILHRFTPDDLRLKMILDVHNDRITSQCHFPLVFAIGVSESEIDFLKLVCDKIDVSNIDAICIDVANGYSIIMLDVINKIKKMYPSLNIIAGNVATKEGFEFLVDSGANAIRVGIGGGSICKTRIQTGIGVPTLHSILDCYEYKMSSKTSVSLIADGGIKYPADLCKSLVAGADAVICGGIFAGTKESPGDTLYDDNGVAWKKYRGAASEEIQVERRGGLKKGTVAEGVSTLVQYKGSLERVTDEFIGGLRSSMTYLSANDLSEFIGRNGRIIRITESGLNESHAYGTKKR